MIHSQMFFVVSRGHNGGEFVSYLVNQSPAFENRARPQYQPYHSFMGTHYRICDDWNLQFDDRFQEFYNDHVRQKRRPPYNVDEPPFVKLLHMYKKLDRQQKLCLFLNVTEYTETVRMVHKYGCKAIGCMQNLRHNPTRHHHVMMEFDPTSTYAEEGPNQNSYDYRALVEQLIDWDTEERAYTYTDFDYVFDHSRAQDTDYVLEMYAALDIPAPDPRKLETVIADYYIKNMPTHEYCWKINQEKM